ncbi:serine hydrolase domain-containing protein [Lapillicoccus jejuensis]|uniref:CubicO group peptidase (Beta-lactamase class C family) n=1 Tax=Lapillicoccus jejuensis TaxID=402171 RepID=A0A542E666_9MICO|nr:serine hydrolase [Lapillicoccus jejuensis]TQJ10830.1 CubicO group peptidase (beta-lactamase class C family) [Lapillicoccus jejuensis]
MSLPRVPSARVGVPAAAVLEVLDGWQERGLELHSLMVLRRGAVAVEGWWSPYDAATPHLLYSLSKTFTSCAVGLAVAEGLCRLDERVVDLLPAHVPPEGVDPRVAALTLHDVLSMSTGHREDTLDTAWGTDPDDLARGFLRIPPDEPVGTLHTYHNTCTYLAGLVVQERCGTGLLEYLTPRLLEPLGIGPGHWHGDGQGHELGFTGLHQRTEDVARLGLLLLQDGVWEGRRVLPEGWVALMTREHVANDTDPTRGPDWRQGYGYQVWRSRHGYRGDGAYGQFCLVVPEADLVVATTAATEDMQGVLDVLWERLLPALDRVDEDAEAAAQERLADRLAALALPVVGPVLPPGGTSYEASYVAPDAGPLAPFAEGTRLTASADGARLRLLLELPAEQGAGAAALSLLCPGDTWGDGPAGLLVRGGRTDAETVEVDLVLAETPHRIRLVGKGTGELAGAWNVTPLAGARLLAHVAAQVAAHDPAHVHDADGLRGPR